jgi:GntR family transcriptional regulator, transcriptional repressor for pyruvate dehydrogenase complex
VPDHVFDRLREAILEGHYQPGDRLPSQRELAADLEVNMASIREALGRLEQLRLVDVRHGSPTRVLDWRRSGGLESLLLGGAGGESALRDLFEARRLLLIEAGRLAAERADAGARSELQALAAAVALAEDSRSALLADWAFMAALVEAASNLVFQLIMNSVRELYLPRAEAFAGIVAEPPVLAPLYAAVAEAVADGDGEAAAGAVERLVSSQESLLIG